MGDKKRHKILKATLWTLLSVFLLLLGTISFLYTSVAQDFLKDAIVKKLNKSPDMKVEIGEFRLSFPADINICGLSMVERGNDTLIAASQFTAEVKLLPLLSGNVEIDKTCLRGARYRIGTPDSAMYLVANIDRFDLSKGLVDLSASNVNLDNAIWDGGSLEMVLKNDTVSTPADTASIPWKINARQIELRNVAYRLSMMPTIDSLDTHFNDALLSDISVDLSEQSVSVGMISGQSLDILYLTPDTTYLANHPELFYEPPVNEDVVASPVWTIFVDTIDFTHSRALYAMKGVTPVNGLDFNYIEIDSLDLKIASFYNAGAVTRIPISLLSGRERSGVNLTGSGVVSVDSAAFKLSDFELATPVTKLGLEILMGTAAIEERLLPMALKCDGDIGISDISRLFPNYSPILNGLPSNDKAKVSVDISGVMGDFDIAELALELEHRLMISASGRLMNLTDVNSLEGNIDIVGTIGDAGFLTSQLLDVETADFVNVPPMTLSGTVNMKNDNIGGTLSAVTDGGRLAMGADWKSRNDTYSLEVKTDSFPINAFLPLLEIGKITGTLNVVGSGFDMMSPVTTMTASAQIPEIEYGGYNYNNLNVWATLAGGHADVGIISSNEDVDLDVTATGYLAEDSMSWLVEGDIRYLDLRAINMSDVKSKGLLAFKVDANLSNEFRNMNILAVIDEVDWEMEGSAFVASDINLDFETCDSLTVAQLINDDLSVKFNSPMSLDSLLFAVDNTMIEIDRQMRLLRLDVDTLQQIIPVFNFAVNAGNNNMISDYMAVDDISFDSFDLMLANNSKLQLNGSASKFKTGTITLDDIKVDVSQQGRFLVYQADVNNEPGTFDDFASISANGYLSGDKVSLFLNQNNIAGEIGYKIGLVASVTDSIITSKFVPNKARVAYKNWTINDDNYIRYNMTNGHFDANLDMRSAESVLQLFTEHTEGSEHQEDLLLKIENFKLADWMSFNPYAPPMSGLISADMRLRYGDGSYNGSGNISVDELYYGKERVGTFDAEVDLTTDVSGALRASAALMVDGVKTMTLSGNLNDTTSVNPFMLDFSMIHFPLRVLNPFMPQDMAQLSGTLNGQMDISGDASAPILNGSLDFDSAFVKIPMIGTSLGISEVKIPVENSKVMFNDFAVTGVNKNSLAINGFVDIADMTAPGIDLTMTAHNMQIIGSEKAKRTDVYGKAFIDLDAKLKGSTDFLDVDATLNLLSGSNLTYIMPDATTLLTAQEEGMVRFVEFADTVAMSDSTKVSESEMLIDLNAKLIISDGTTINVDLSTDGHNRVQLQGNGQFTYTMNPMADSRFTGRYTINKGFVRYTPPLMSEKHFVFKEGSYVAFTGDILNPTLSLYAVDNMRANVTREGQNSRLVNFDVSLAVTNTLSHMDVTFDLSTPDDITVANELSTMSAEQRANQAMNLLLYNVYTGPGTKANADLSGNPLYSFLESKVNTWAANNIKFVDVSFGIDQYNSTTDGATSKTTSYSYRVSKTLFNDRFKIVVGGNYSTDADAEENFAQNLFNDISFEYMLNRSGSMYIKLFRHVGFESILEGEVTQTGVGFVYKRKIHSLKDLFRF